MLHVCYKTYRNNVCVKTINTSVLTNASVLDLSDRCNVTAFMGHIDRLGQTGVVLRSQPAHAQGERSCGGCMFKIFT